MAEERGDRLTQRAVISFLLDEFPARHSAISLWWMGLGDLEEVEESIRLLDLHGLLWRDGPAVVPTAAARHFDWLELS
ncbi:MAG TPA: hypothetical protein VFY75_07450 [Solirubrobacterales bacterium]|nr:hypothetical protein [Solirubrobacterales bacterium]